MKKYKLTILFTQPPFGTATSREGLDALLATSAFCDEEQLAICFLNDGVFNLLANQLPENILQKDHISTFKLIELYELNHCFICQDSIKARNLSNVEWLLNNLQFAPQQRIFDILQQSEKILTF